MLPLSWVEESFPDIKHLAAHQAGGQKVVFTGVHRDEGDVVLKLILPTTSQDAVSREVLAVQLVHSSRVPEIFAVGTQSSPVGEITWIREQRIMGCTLRHLMSQGHLSPAQILIMTYHVLQALYDAESAKIVHRDVKPENIMIDQAGSFWLLDFGIARHLSMPALTATISAFGKFTPGYAPVEQFRNIQSDIDARADLFALGVTVHECVNLTHPFINGARDVMEVLSKVETYNLSRVCVQCKMQNQFADLIEAMTKKRRDHRIRYVEEALEWMREIITEEGLPQ